MRLGVVSMLMVALLSMGLVSNSNVYSGFDSQNFSILEYSIVSKRLILIFQGFHDTYYFYGVEALSGEPFVVEVRSLNSGGMEITVRYVDSILVSDDKSANISIVFTLLLYKNYVYNGDDLIGFSPFYFDEPVTYDYLLSRESPPQYLNSELYFPDKPVKIVGYKGFEVILLYSVNRLSAVKIGSDDVVTGRLNVPLYEAEVRGRIPLTIKVLIPHTLLSNDTISLFESLVSNELSPEPSLKYIYLDLALSQDFIDKHRAELEDEPICINLCPSIGISLDILAIFALLILLVILAILIRRARI